MSATNRRPVATAKSRKNLLKQAGSFVGTSQPQPQALAATPLPAAPLVFGNQANAQFSYNSGTLPEKETSLPAAPLVFGNQANAQFSFNSGTMSEKETFLPAAPPVFGNQNQSSTKFAFPSATQPEEESLEKMAADMEAELAKPPTPLGNTHATHYPDYGLDRIIGLDTYVPAAPEAAQDPNVTQYPDPDTTYSLPYFAQDTNIQYPGLSRPSSSQCPKSAVDPSFFSGLEIARDPVAENSSLDQNLSFPLDPNLGLSNEHDNLKLIAAFNATSAPSLTEYPDPNVPDTARSFPYFVPDSNAQDSELPRPTSSQNPKSAADLSFLPGLNVVQDSIPQDLSFHPEPSFPLDPHLGVSNEHDNLKLIAAFNATSAPSVTQYPDLNASDTACSLPYFFQDSNVRDPEFSHQISSQDSKAAVDATFVPNPKVAQDQFARDSVSHHELSFHLDPSLDLANDHGNPKLISAFNATTAPNVAQHSDNLDIPSFLPNFVQNSTVQDPRMPLPNSSQDPNSAAGRSFVPNLTVAQDPGVQDPMVQDPMVQDPIVQDPIVQDSIVQDPTAQGPIVQDPTAQGPILQDPIVQDPIIQAPTIQDPIVQNLSHHQEPSFLLGPQCVLANEHGNLKPIAAFNATPALNVAQHPNVLDLSSFLPNFIQASSVQYPRMPLTNRFQDPKPSVDHTPSFIPNLNVARNLLATQSSFPLDPSLGLADERGHLQPADAFAAPALNSIQPQPISENNANFERKDQYQDLQSNSGFQMNMLDPSRAFDINTSEFKQNQRIEMPGFPKSPSTAAGQNLDENEDSHIDLMDLAPDYKTTPPSWKHNQLTQNRFDSLGRGGLPDDPTNPNLVSVPSHISSSVTFMGYPQPRKASAQGADLNKSFDQAQTGNISKEPATENGTPLCDSIASTVSGSKFIRQLAEIGPQPAPYQEMVPKVNAREKRGTIAASANLLGKLPIPVTSTEQTVVPHPDTLAATLQVEREAIDQREMEKLKAEIEHQNKAIHDKDEKIRQSAHELQDQEKKSIHMIKQLCGDLDNLREEKSTLEKANCDLVSSTREMKDLQGKAKKNTDLIKRLSGELGNLRKKKSTLEKANESLSKENVEIKVGMDKLCQSSLSLKEENRNLVTAVNDLRQSNLMLGEAKETIRAQNVEIQDKSKTIATLNACIDQISPELLWRTEQVREVEGLVLLEESISKWYRDRYCLLWDKNEALESAGVLRDVEIAKLELEKERKHQEELEALNFRITGLEVENKSLAQRLGEVRVDAEEADTADEKVCDVYDDGWTRFTDEI